MEFQFVIFYFHCSFRIHTAIYTYKEIEKRRILQFFSMFPCSNFQGKFKLKIGYSMQFILWFNTYRVQRWLLLLVWFNKFPIVTCSRIGIHAWDIRWIFLVLLSFFHSFFTFSPLKNYVFYVNAFSFLFCFDMLRLILFDFAFINKDVNENKKS